MARFLQKMYSLSTCALDLILLGQYAAATFNGPGKISVKYGGALDGCLDQTMKWVVDGNCGVFTAKALSGGSKSTSLVLVVPRRTMAGAWNSL
jgi:hypothetical protein